MTDLPTLADLLGEREKLLADKEANNAVLAACRGQMDSAKGRVLTDGNYSDPKWWAAVQARARYAGQKDQAIARRLSELKPLVTEARQRERATFAQASANQPVALLIAGLRQIQQAIDLLRESEADDPNS